MGQKAIFFPMILIGCCIEVEIWTTFPLEVLPLPESITGKHGEGSYLAAKPGFPPSMMINHYQTFQPSACRCSRLYPKSNRSEGFSRIVNFLETKFLSIPQDYFIFPSNEILRSWVYEPSNLAFLASRYNWFCCLLHYYTVTNTYIRCKLKYIGFAALTMNLIDSCLVQKEACFSFMQNYRDWRSKWGSVS